MMNILLEYNEARPKVKHLHILYGLYRHEWNREYFMEYYNDLIATDIDALYYFLRDVIGITYEDIQSVMPCADRHGVGSQCERIFGCGYYSVK